MRFICVLLSFFVALSSFSQVINGSFEDGSTSDLSQWEWTCGAQPYHDAPAGGGNWCIKVSGGNTQGCIPGYAFQRILSATNGQSFVLSGWAYTQSSPLVGIYFGKINNGAITILAGDTTSSALWASLSVQSVFTLSAGDTAAVVLYGGLTGGPVQGYGYFDLISLRQVNGIYFLEQKQSLNVFPDPFSVQTIIQTKNILRDASLFIYNSYGQISEQLNHISGQTITLQRGNLPCGIYYIRLVQDDKTSAVSKIIITD